MADTVASTKIGRNGSLLKIELTPTGSREEDVSALTEVFDFGDLTRSVSDLASAMTAALRRAKPDEAEVTFGIDATLESGKLTSLIVKGSGGATFQVRLLWKAGQPASSSTSTSGAEDG